MENMIKETLNTNTHIQLFRVEEITKSIDKLNGFVRYLRKLMKRPINMYQDEYLESQ